MGSEPRVRDVMRTEFKSVLPDATVREAVERLYTPQAEECRAGIPAAQSLMVISGDGGLVGIVTMFDIMEAIEPQYLRVERSHLAGITWEGLFEEAVDLAENRLVQDIMTPSKDFRVLSIDDPLMKALELMVEENTPRLPVCEDGRMVGVVRMYEIFQAVAREMLGNGDEHP
jgi:CBS domain-containing protein